MVFILNLENLVRVTQSESRASLTYRDVPTGSPSRDGKVAVYVLDKNQPNLPTPFYYGLASISVFTALTAVFRSINPDSSLPSHSILAVFFLLYRSFPLYISL